MPKKFGANSKSQEANERKENVKKEKNAKAQKEYEDSLWTDQGSTAAERRKAEKDAKKAEEARKKAEKKALYEKDQAAVAVHKPQAKVTASQLLSMNKTKTNKDKQEEEERLEAEELAEKRIVKQMEIFENTNRKSAEDEAAEIERFGRANIISASGIDEALDKLSLDQHKSSGLEDRHPEKRLKAAFKEYEQRWWPLLKAEHPTLKFSQLKNRLWEQWKEAPENPLNQAKAAAAAAALAAAEESSSSSSS